MSQSFENSPPKDTSAMSASTVEEKGQLGDLSIEPRSNASSEGWHDEEKGRDDTRQSSIAQDSHDAHDLEAIETRSLAGSQPPAAPDGGLHAWLKVFGGFLIYMNIWCARLFLPHYILLLTNLPGASLWLTALFNPTILSPCSLTSRRHPSHGSEPSKAGSSS